MGMVKLPVPVYRSGAKVSPIPCRAPPPCGKAISWPDVLELLLTGTPSDRHGASNHLDRHERATLDVVVTRPVARRVYNRADVDTTGPRVRKAR